MKTQEIEIVNIQYNVGWQCRECIASGGMCSVMKETDCICHKGLQARWVQDK